MVIKNFQWKKQETWASQKDGQALDLINKAAD